MSKRVKANAMLVAAAMIWGAAFVAQSVGMEYVGPFTFQTCRCLLGGLVLLPVIAVSRRRRPQDAPAGTRRDLWVSGLLCGAALFVATSFQQIGILYTTAGKAGFITALYVVLVPCAGLLIGRRAPLTVWLGALIAVAALYLLCVDESFTIGRGELLVLVCAVCFTVQIMLVDHYVGRVDGVRLACLQFFVCAALSLVCMLAFETPTLASILRCWLPIGYAGILSCGVAYTFQILGQRDTAPAVASLLLSLESVFAVLFGALILRERLTGKEYLGCLLMFAAILLAQLPHREKERLS